MDIWYGLWCASLCSPATWRRWREERCDEQGVIERLLDARGELGEAWDRDGVLRRIAVALERSERAQRTARFGPVRVLETDAHSLGAASASRSPYLVVAGEPELSRVPALAIVGTRRLEAGDRDCAARLIDSVLACCEVEVVSGGALGVDTIAHDTALERRRRCVIALAGGIAHAGPASNRGSFARVVEQGGLIVTERPPHAEPSRFEFVERNRMIAALSRATLVVRAPAESGALATAAFAGSMRRPVLAVPGRPGDRAAEGCHALLRRGARLCDSPADVAAVLGLPQSQWLLPWAEPRAFSPRGAGLNGPSAAPAPDLARAGAETRAHDPSPARMARTVLLDALGEEARVLLGGLGAEATDVDSVARRAGVTAAAASRALLELELAGLVEALPGARYRLTPALHEG